jgi:hypothetical protein
MTAYDPNPDPNDFCSDEDDVIDVNRMSEDALRRELTEARKTIDEAMTLIMQWKGALVKIGHAARKGDVETIKQLASEALA